MKHTIEIEKHTSSWSLQINKGAFTPILSGYKSAKNALEAGSKKLLELIEDQTFDFGQGLVPAHKHKNGGGWVADSAHVDDTAYIGHNAQVYGETRVCGHARILDYAKVFENAYVYGYAEIQGNSKIYQRAFVYGNSVVSSAQVCGRVKICGETRVCINSFLS